MTIYRNKIFIHFTIFVKIYKEKSNCGNYLHVWLVLHAFMQFHLTFGCLESNLLMKFEPLSSNYFSSIFSHDFTIDDYAVFSYFQVRAWSRICTSGTKMFFYISVWNPKLNNVFFFKFWMQIYYHSQCNILVFSYPYFIRMLFQEQNVL